MSYLLSSKFVMILLDTRTCSSCECLMFDKYSDLRELSSEYLNITEIMFELTNMNISTCLGGVIHSKGTISYCLFDVIIIFCAYNHVHMNHDLVLKYLRSY